MEMIEWVDIGNESKNFKRMAYSDNTLYIEYKKNKEMYKYLDVPIEIWQRIWNKEYMCPRTKGPSYGATIFNLVINAGYRYEKVK